MDEDHEALGDDPAAAFEALRAEVAALRASLGEGAGRVAPDYAPTLGKMAATLAKIEAHPALQLTPEAFAYQVRQARDAAQQQGSRDMSAAIQRVDAAGADLELFLLDARVEIAPFDGRQAHNRRRRHSPGSSGTQEATVSAARERDFGCFAAWERGFVARIARSKAQQGKGTAERTRQTK